MSSETPLLNPIEKVDSLSASGPATKRGNEISLLDLLIILAKRKRMIVRTTTVFAVLATLVSLVLPVRYTATITVLTPQQNSSLTSALASQLGNLGGLGALAGSSSSLLKNPNDMFVAIFKSRSVEEAMVQQFGLMQEYHTGYLSDTTKAFENKTNVDGSGKDGLIRITVDDHDPNRAAELANGYVDQVRNFSKHLAITEASQRRLFFEQQLEKAKDNLANAEEALKRTQQTTGVIEPDIQTRALIESAAAVRAQIISKEVEMQTMQTYATEENSQYVEAERELASLRGQLTKLEGSAASGDGEIVVPKGRVPQTSLEYLRKLRDVRYNEMVFEVLAKQFEGAKLDEAKQGSLIQVVDRALPPDKPTFPKRGLIIFSGTAAGFIFGIIAALCQVRFGRLNDDPHSAVKLNRLGWLLSLKRRKTS